MKYLIFMIWLIFSISVTNAETYYVSNSNGNDSDSGRTAALAWKTLSKVNSAKYVAGDSILLKRGDTWFGQLIPKSGSPENHIFWGAYGAGNKPVIHESILLSSGDWTNEGSGVWSTHSSNEIGNILFNSNASVGWRKWSLKALVKQGDWCYDFRTDKVYLKSSLIPSAYYSNVRILLCNRIVELNGVNYGTFDNLDLRYSGYEGIGATSISTTGITITNCDISWCGGKMYTKHTRLGNGIGFWRNISNILIENCRIFECYDAGITPQYTGKATGVIETNFTVRNCQIWNCEYGFEYFNRSNSGETSNFLIENNTFYGCGLGWGHAQRPDPTGRALRLAGTPAKTKKFVIQNNIFLQATDALLSSYSAEMSYTIDYNCFHNTIGDIADINFKNISNFVNYKKMTGWDAHSINSNPLLKSISTLDFSLSSNSPAINAGNPDSTFDPDRTTRDIGYLYLHQHTPENYNKRQNQNHKRKPEQSY